ncbi:hypothetical protein FNH22_12855 [Fulvivirga sp. M361]|uniref:hypothetical protein n=1 Tax=Fulvivirga sp. M361 TaxID=2594266 RepID=UPI001179C936|nr:hypothetical protein [Fulvivirga sp. M361]TRX58760.1 hypothetical protein FNH22_12855 [Fulvivirga sp. M361]
MLLGCIKEFDNQLVINDLRKKYPELEMIKINSSPCDGTFGDCYYVNVTFKPSKFDDEIDTSFQYNRMGNSHNELALNETYGNYETLNEVESCMVNRLIERSPELLYPGVWGLHKMIRIDLTETEVILGDSDSSITFNSDSTLVEYDSGIERSYTWKINENAFIEIREMKREFPEKYKSFLRLEQIKTIEKLDSLNLILITCPKGGVQYRYHYMKF